MLFYLLIRIRNKLWYSFKNILNSFYFKKRNNERINQSLKFLETIPNHGLLTNNFIQFQHFLQRIKDLAEKSIYNKCLTSQLDQSIHEEEEEEEEEEILYTKEQYDEIFIQIKHQLQSKHQELKKFTTWTYLTQMNLNDYQIDMVIICQEIDEASYFAVAIVAFEANLLNIPHTLYTINELSNDYENVTLKVTANSLPLNISALLVKQWLRDDELEIKSVALYFQPSIFIVTKVPTSSHYLLMSNVVQAIFKYEHLKAKIIFQKIKKEIFFI